MVLQDLKIKNNLKKKKRSDAFELIYIKAIKPIAHSFDQDFFFCQPTWRHDINYFKKNMSMALQCKTKSVCFFESEI